MDDLGSFLTEATARFAAIPELDERLVRVPNPDQWLFNEATFRPMAERLVTEAAHLPARSREGISKRLRLWAGPARIVAFER